MPSKNITAAQLAKLLSGAVEGDENIEIFRPSPIEFAQEGDISFLDNPRYEHYAYTTKASILLVHRSFKPSQPISPTLVRVDDVRAALAILLEKFDGVTTGQDDKVVTNQVSLHKTATIGVGTILGEFSVIEEGAIIGNNCIIYPQVYIGRNVRIGNNCRIYPGVKIHYDCQIGDNCILHANAVVGADGFGFAPLEDKTWKKVPQVGNVVLENDVEIGACTCIDRAALGSTIIRQGVKMDNLIQVAHNVKIGQNSILAAQVGIAGSTSIGENCHIGGQVGFAGHINIAEGTKIQAQSGLARPITEPDTVLFGSPAIDYNNYIKSYAVFKKLPDLQKQLHQLTKLVEALQEKLP